ncbi:MAG: FtsQ-type POTRA domain-containing protein [Candidatus Faecousia sp.]|nr:FtsQ-type POTRA domain-containing protein [Bacillota bacterium]MDY2810607.1 FtsQ-type POTRA domain-containing protein [Candidatus Faecousia sp.]
MDTKEQRRQAPSGKRPPAAKGPARKPMQNARTRAQTRSRTAPQALAAQQRPVRKRNAPQVVYTPAQTISFRRMLLRILVVAAVALALCLSLSIFFKVKTVTVAGAEKYTPWSVMEASGIQEGESLISLNTIGAAARVLKALPYVESVQVGIKLPDTVNIEIKEYEVAYAIRDQDGLWWRITSNGKVLEQVNGGQATENAQILGVVLASPAVNEQAVAGETATATAATDETAESTETVATQPNLIQPAQRLSTVLGILQQLEAHEILGQVASIDVSDMSRIVLWYGTQYEVILGDETQMEKKVAAMTAAIRSSLQSYDSGTLDVSFTIWPDSVGMTPFAE